MRYIMLLLAFLSILGCSQSRNEALDYVKSNVSLSVIELTKTEKGYLLILQFSNQGEYGVTMGHCSQSIEKMRFIKSIGESELYSADYEPIAFLSMQSTGIIHLPANSSRQVALLMTPYGYKGEPTKFVYRYTYMKIKEKEYFVPFHEISCSIEVNKNL